MWRFSFGLLSKGFSIYLTEIRSKRIIDYSFVLFTSIQIVKIAIRFSTNFHKLLLYLLISNFYLSKNEWNKKISGLIRFSEIISDVTYEISGS